MNLGLQKALHSFNYAYAKKISIFKYKSKHKVNAKNIVLYSACIYEHVQYTITFVLRRNVTGFAFYSKVSEVPNKAPVSP